MGSGEKCKALVSLGASGKGRLGGKKQSIKGAISLSPSQQLLPGSENFPSQEHLLSVGAVFCFLLAEHLPTGDFPGSASSARNPTPWKDTQAAS